MVATRRDGAGTRRLEAARDRHDGEQSYRQDASLIHVRIVARGGSDGYTAPRRRFARCRPDSAEKTNEENERRALARGTAATAMRAKHSDSPASIPGELQASWIRQLAWHYDLINYQFLDSALRPPTFRLSESIRKLGEWNPVHRTLTIGFEHIWTNSWEAVLDTMRHEMAHQYVHEILGLVHAPPHGAAFELACKKLRCDASATAEPDGTERLEESTAERDKILARIRDLFALAGSPNEHEAANAMRMAQKYLLKYNLELADLDRSRGYRMRFLGECSARTQEYEYTLSTILKKHFFVQVIWTHSYDARDDRAGKLLEIYGTPQNLDVAEYVYEYVMRVAESLWDERKHELVRSRAPGQRGTRLQYLAGLLRGLLQKLDSQQHELSEDHGLVWAGDERLKEFYRHHNPRIGSVSTSGVSRNGQFNAGVRDGREITIRRGVSDAAAERGRRIEGPRG